MNQMRKRAVGLVLMAFCMFAMAEDAPVAPAPKIAYVASKLREPFHTPDCEWAKKISKDNLETFATRDAAIKAGHRPCKVCKP